MDSIHDYLITAIDSFLSLSSDSDDGPSLDEFVSNWESTIKTSGLFEDDIAIPHNLADDIDQVCETLMTLTVVDGALSRRLDESLDIVKTHLIPPHTTAENRTPSPSSSRQSSPTPSSSSSRESSPAPSRRASPRPSRATSPTVVDQQPLADSKDMPSTQEKATTEVPTSSPPTLSSRVCVPGSLTTVEPETNLSSVAGPSSVSSSRSRSPSPSTDTQPPTPTTPTSSPAYIQPLLDHLVAHPYNPYPHKSFLAHVATSTSTSEKDVNTYLRSLRSKLGWNRIQKRYFPKPQWTQWQMIAWLEGLWRFEHLQQPNFEEWDKYQGPDGLGGKMNGLDAELAVVVHDLKRMTERREGPTEVAKVLNEVDWEEFVEKKSLKRKAEEDEAAHRRVVSEPTKKRPRSESEESQVVPEPTKKRSRSESPESDDGTPPPPSKRHCSLPTMSLSSPPELTCWQTSAWVPPAQVSLNTFSYDLYTVPVLVDDESEDGSEGGSVGPSTPETADHISLPSWDFSFDVSQPQPTTLNVSTLPDVSFPELLNLDLFSPAYTSTGKDLPSATPSMDHYIPIQPLADDLPFDFDSQSWSFNYDGLNLDLGVDWNSIGVEGM